MDDDTVADNAIVCHRDTGMQPGRFSDPAILINHAACTDITAIANHDLGANNGPGSNPHLPSNTGAGVNAGGAVNHRFFHGLLPGPRLQPAGRLRKKQIGIVGLDQGAAKSCLARKCRILQDHE